jgi:hypothetical protein
MGHASYWQPRKKRMCLMIACPLCYSYIQMIESLLQCMKVFIDEQKKTSMNINVRSPALHTRDDAYPQYAGDASGQASILLPRAGPSTGSAHACTTSGCPICGFSLPVGATHSCADHPGRPCMDEVVKVAAKGMQNAYDKLKWASGADV